MYKTNPETTGTANSDSVQSGAISKRKHRVLTLLLAVSVVLNITLIFNYMQMAQRQTLTWSNETGELARVGFWLAHDSSEPTVESLTGAMANMQSMREVLNAATLLPHGQDIIPSSTVQKILSFLQYEQRVVQLMQQELREKGKVSEDNLKRWQIINQGWENMFRTLQEENKKADAFSRIFRKQVWQKIYADASKALDEVDPLPLPRY